LQPTEGHFTARTCCADSAPAAIHVRPWTAGRQIRVLILHEKQLIAAHGAKRVVPTVAVRLDHVVACARFTGGPRTSRLQTRRRAVLPNLPGVRPSHPFQPCCVYVKQRSQTSSEKGIYGSRSCLHAAVPNGPCKARQAQVLTSCGPLKDFRCGRASRPRRIRILIAVLPTVVAFVTGPDERRKHSCYRGNENNMSQRTSVVERMTYWDCM
jgi:hypothetical protein